MPRDLEWLEERLVESCELLEEATREHHGICSALGLDPDEMEDGDVAMVAGRIVADLERHEQLASASLQLLQVQHVEVALLRGLVARYDAEARELRGILREAMEATGVDPTSDGAVSAFVGRLYDHAQAAGAEAAE